jgi:ATP-dependent Clp protease adaptor protein ClpS
MGNTLTKQKERVESHGHEDIDEPSRFKVLLHNDDYTTMDFVVMILQSVFNKDLETATEIMLNVHKKGVGVAGIYSRDVAETKVAVVSELSRKNEHPLKCTMEEV